MVPFHNPFLSAQHVSIPAEYYPTALPNALIRGQSAESKLIIQISYQHYTIILIKIQLLLSGLYTHPKSFAQPQLLSVHYLGNPTTSASILSTFSKEKSWERPPHTLK